MYKVILRNKCFCATDKKQKSIEKKENFSTLFPVHPFYLYKNISYRKGESSHVENIRTLYCSRNPVKGSSWPYLPGTCDFFAYAYSVIFYPISDR